MEKLGPGTSRRESSRRLGSTEGDDSSFDFNMEQMRSYRIRKVNSDRGSEIHHNSRNNKYDDKTNHVAPSGNTMKKRNVSAVQGSQNDESNHDSEEKVSEKVQEEEEEEYTTKLPAHHAIVGIVQSFRYRVGTLVNCAEVQSFVVFLISLNAIMLGIATYPMVRLDPYVSNIFGSVDKTCLIIFTIELFMQFIFHGWRLFLNGWLLFDTFIIVVSWAFSGISVIRAFRIIRALRLVTRVKIMKNLIVALFSVVPRMFAIGILLCLFSYIFAVLFTQLFKNLYKEGYTDFDYFGRLDYSFFTLFQVMTLDSWGDMTRMMVVVYPWAWIPVVIYVIITAFVVANLIIAVICDAIYALHDEDKAMILGGHTHSDIHDLVEGPEYSHPAHAELNPTQQHEHDMRCQLDELEFHIDRLADTQDEILSTMNLLMRRISRYQLENEDDSYNDDYLEDEHSYEHEADHDDGEEQEE